MFTLLTTLVCFPSPSCIFQSIQEMGNTKARQLYEANLPDSFRRPQTDQYPPSSGHIDKRIETCYALNASFSLTLTPELWNSSSGINMRRRNTTVRKWPMGAVYVSIQFLKKPCNFYGTQLNCFGFPLLSFVSRKMLRKSGTLTEGAERHLTAKWAVHFPLWEESPQSCLFLHAFISILIFFKEWRIKTCPQK